MSRKCTICAHLKRKEIDKLLVLGGTSYNKLAAQFGLPASTIRRHFNKGHISIKIQKAEAVMGIREGKSLLDKISELLNIAHDTIHESTAEGDLRTKCAAIREYRATLEFYGKATGEIPDRKEITGPGGGPILLAHMTDEEVMKRAREIFHDKH